MYLTFQVINTSFEYNFGGDEPFLETIDSIVQGDQLPAIDSPEGELQLRFQVTLNDPIVTKNGERLSAGLIVIRPADNQENERGIGAIIKYDFSDQIDVRIGIPTEQLSDIKSSLVQGNLPESIKIYVRGLSDENDDRWDTSSSSIKILHVSSIQMSLPTISFKEESSLKIQILSEIYNLRRRLNWMIFIVSILMVFLLWKLVQFI